jgi:hypothetical protein
MHVHFRLSVNNWRIRRLTRSTRCAPPLLNRFARSTRCAPPLKNCSRTDGGRGRGPGPALLGGVHIRRRRHRSGCQDAGYAIEAEVKWLRGPAAVLRAEAGLDRHYKYMTWCYFRTGLVSCLPPATGLHLCKTICYYVVLPVNTRQRHRA